MRFEFDVFVLDLGREQLFLAGRSVPLTPKAYGVLCLLMDNRPNVVDKDTIAARIWGAPVSDAALTMVLTELRKSLGDSAAQPRFIRTAHKRGYAFICEVRAIGSEEQLSEYVLVIGNRAVRLSVPETTLFRSSRDHQLPLLVDQKA